jgi:hypothetical protein
VSDVLAVRKYPGSAFPLTTDWTWTGGEESEIARFVHCMNPFCICL